MWFASVALHALGQDYMQIASENRRQPLLPGTLSRHRKLMRAEFAHVVCTVTAECKSSCHLKATQRANCLRTCSIAGTDGLSPCRLSVSAVYRLKDPSNTTPSRTLIAAEIALLRGRSVGSKASTSCTGVVAVIQHHLLKHVDQTKSVH